jgi:arginine/ornithine transport system permease protein
LDDGTFLESLQAVFAYNVVLDSLDLYLTGLLVTLQLLVGSLACGLVIAILAAIAMAAGPPSLRWPVWSYVYFFRGTPALVQLFMIYYGLGQFEAVRESFAWPLLREAWFCALLMLTLNTGAYTAEILRGAILATPAGEVEAARAFGMSGPKLYRRIVLPLAFRRALPAYGNEVIIQLHTTSLASIVTLIDITGAARIVNSRYYTPYEAFLTAAVLYLCITFVIVTVFRRVEHRIYAHLRPRPGTH